MKTETLHLDDSQISELERMVPGHARLLRLWRDASKPDIYKLAQMEPQQADAICYSHNSAEMCAAECYWAIKREACESWCASPSLSDRTRKECLEKLAAISAALEEIR